MSEPHADGAEPDDGKRAREGLISALIAYTCWGLLPIYFVIVREVDSFELLIHRLIWAVPFGALIVHFRHQWPEVKRAFTHRGMLGYLTLTAVLIGTNWLVYILAVQYEQIFQASLGYYMNPLMFAIAGVVLFGEKLRPNQRAAIGIAAIGVAVLSVSGDGVPWIAIVLGSLFTVYGIIRKKVQIGGMPGLFVETVVLFPFGLVYLVYIMVAGTAVFSLADPGMAVILMLGGPFTVIPLLFFALAAKRLNLATLGMLQYIAPTLQFLVGYYYGEVLTVPHLICFVCIWTAVGLFTWDAWRASRRMQAQAGSARRQPSPTPEKEA